MLTILGLGLGAYIAWTGIMAAQRMPIAIVMDDGITAIHQLTARVVTLSLSTLQVVIVILLLLEIT
jgi:hypothetical protein